MLGIVHLAGAALLPQPSVTFRRDEAPRLHLPDWKHKRLARGPSIMSKRAGKYFRQVGGRQALLAYSGLVRPSMSGQRNILSVPKASHPKISKYQLEFQRLYFFLAYHFLSSFPWGIRETAWRAEAQRAEEGEE